MLLPLLLLTAAASALSQETIAVSNDKEDSPVIAAAIDATPEEIKRVQEVWGEWIVDTPCTDSCGGCGRVHYSRECLCAGEEGCPCSEGEKRVDVCATNLCQFPRRTCCEGFKKTATANALRCAPVNEAVEREIHERDNPVVKRKDIEKTTVINTKTEVTNEETKKGEGAVWSDWTATTSCSDTCGSCGNITETRDCLCAGEEGCPCSERETRVEICGKGLCHFPRHTCCEGFHKASGANGWECQPVQGTAERKTSGPVDHAAVRKLIEKKNADVIERKKAVLQSFADVPKQRAAKTLVVPPVRPTVWSEWIITTPCSDTCGSCGTAEHTRECLCAGEEGCPCSERQSKVDVCGTGLCQFPRRTCCDGFHKVHTDHGFKCERVDQVQHSDNVIVSSPTRLSTESPVVPRRLEREEAEETVHADAEINSNRYKLEEKPAWGEWVVRTPCTDTCGGCGRIHLTRECLCAGDEGCPCREQENRVEVCGTNMCPFPRATCCTGFVKTVTYSGFKCVAEKESEERICAGEWTPWVEDKAVAPCPAPCGMCGKRRVATRRCEPANCECTGETELFESCGRHPCRDGAVCCEGFVKGRVDGREECVPASSIPPSLSAASRKFLERRQSEKRKLMEGRKGELGQILPVLSSPDICTWSEWTEVESECSGSCGMCGVRVSARRTCNPVGCNCSGPSTRYEDCGEGVCEDREKPCCGFYTQATVNGVPTCIDPADAVDEKPKIIPQKRDSTKTTKPSLSTSTCRGIWSPFTASPLSPCNHACGLCGHRAVAERQCIPEGCTCEGSNKLYERCGEKPCWEKNNGCCDGAAIVLVDGKRICKEIDQ